MKKSNWHQSYSVLRYIRHRVNEDNLLPQEEVMFSSWLDNNENLFTCIKGRRTRRQKDIAHKRMVLNNKRASAD